MICIFPFCIVHTSYVVVGVFLTRTESWQRFKLTIEIWIVHWDMFRSWGFFFLFFLQYITGYPHVFTMKMPRRYCPIVPREENVPNGGKKSVRLSNFMEVQ